MKIKEIGSRGACPWHSHRSANASFSIVFFLVCVRLVELDKLDEFN